MRCLTETTGWIVPRRTEGICRGERRNDSARVPRQPMCVKEQTERAGRFSYLFTGWVFLMQHIKLPITRTRKRSEPTASDTVSTSEPVSASTKRIVQHHRGSEDEHGAAIVRCLGSKMR